jgi:DNA-binding NtrC family response regulator
MEPKILLIEDDHGAALALQKVLNAQGYQVTWTELAGDGLKVAHQGACDLVITDLMLPDLSGMDVVKELCATRPALAIIVMTAHGTTDTAIEATRLGAYDYLVKPFEVEEALRIVAKGLAQSALRTEPVETLGHDSRPSVLNGQSKVMQAIYKEIGRVAATSVMVLIRGQTGTGKELVARAIHQHSDRAGKQFVAVNCAAVPETLLESELFGHERGAFTGAHTRRIGRFELAHRGTIFLDEIGDLSPGTQAKLLRVLQQRTIQRVGGNEVIPVDARVLAATHRDLETAIENGAFREDLFYRLSVVTIRLPSLAQRREDIPGLVKFFIRRYARDFGITSPRLQPEAISELQSQSWPGNVRELENVVQRALLMARPHGSINLEHIREASAKEANGNSILNLTTSAYIRSLLACAQDGQDSDGTYSKMIAGLEPELFEQAIRLARGNKSQAARWLGVTRLKLREKLSEFGLDSLSADPDEE